MALPASFTFANATDSELAAADSRWTWRGAVASEKLLINAAGSYLYGQDTEAVYYWNADTFDADHYSATQGVWSGANQYNSIGPAVRIQTGAQTFYAFMCGGMEFVSGGANSTQAGCFVKEVAGTTTVLGSYLSKPADNVVVKLTAEGTNPVTLKVYYDGALQGSYDDSSSPLSTGIPGVAGWVVTIYPHLKNWEGGNLTSSPSGSFRRITASGRVS